MKPDIHFDLNEKCIQKDQYIFKSGGGGHENKHIVANRFYEINNLHRFYLMPVCKSTKLIIFL